MINAPTKVWQLWVLLALLVIAAAVFFFGEALSQPAATVLAACLVPTLGFVGFRYQKDLDRTANALEFRRNVYDRYIQLAHEYLEDTVKDKSPGLWQLHLQADRVYLHGTDQVAKAVSAHLFSANYFGRYSSELDVELWDQTREGFEASLDSLVSAMRADLVGVTSIPSPSLTRPGKAPRD